MSVAETFNPASINLSARAVQKVRALVTEEDNDDLKLRVFITGGGCSGFQYGFTFDEIAAEDNLGDEDLGAMPPFEQPAGPEPVSPDGADDSAAVGPPLRNLLGGGVAVAQ